MENVDKNELLKQVGITTVSVLLISSIIFFAGQPVLSIIEQQQGGQMFLGVIMATFIFVGYGFSEYTQYRLATVIIGISITYTIWPYLIELVLSTQSLSLISNIMWLGFTLGSVSTAIQSRLTSGER